MKGLFRFLTQSSRTYAGRLMSHALFVALCALPFGFSRTPGNWAFVMNIAMALLASARTPRQHRIGLIGIGLIAAVANLRMLMGNHEAWDVTVATTSVVMLGVLFWLYRRRTNRFWPRQAWLECRDGSRVDLELHAQDSDDIAGLQWIAYSTAGSILVPPRAELTTNHPDAAYPPQVSLSTITDEDGRQWLQPRVTSESW